LAKLRAFDTKLYSVGSGKAVESLDLRLLSLDEKINILDSKLNSLADPATNPSTRASASNPEAAGSNRRTVRITKLGPMSPQSLPDEVLNLAASERRPQATIIRFANGTVAHEAQRDHNLNNKAFQRRSVAPGAGGGGPNDFVGLGDKLADDVAVVKDSVNRIEARLTTLTGLMWPKMAYLIRSVSEIHGAIIEDLPARVSHVF
jgi:hypothetical protein